MPAIYSVHACNTRTRATNDLYCVVEFVSVIEASRSVVFVYYQGRESICRVHLCDWGIKICYSLRLSADDCNDLYRCESYILDLHAPINIKLLGMWSSCSIRGAFGSTWGHNFYMDMQNGSKPEVWWCGLSHASSFPYVLYREAIFSTHVLSEWAWPRAHINVTTFTRFAQNCNNI